MVVQGFKTSTLGSTTFQSPVITWEKLPDDFILPDDPVDNINQNPIANALSDTLSLAGFISETAFTCTDYGLIATVNGKTIAKAPDWAYVPHIKVSREVIERSYTPYLEGDVPTIVIEIISATDGGEYSKQLEKPMGKWYFYEQVLKVPYYGIFEPSSGDFELYRLGDLGLYDRVLMEESGRYWIEGMNLAIAAWKGQRDYRNGYWLRFWDGNDNLLPWSNEVIETAEIKLIQTRQALDQEKARADRLTERLRSLGIDPE
jgi:Putative restriction endonuclease